MEKRKQIHKETSCKIFVIVLKSISVFSHPGWEVITMPAGLLEWPGDSLHSSMLLQSHMGEEVVKTGIPGVQRDPGSWWCPDESAGLECLLTSHRWEIQSCFVFPSGHNSHRNLWSGRELLPVFASETVAHQPLSLCAYLYRHWSISVRGLFELDPPGCVHTHGNVCKR